VATAAGPSWGTIQESAEHYGVGTKTIRRWIADGRIQAKRIGPRLIRVDLNSLDNMGQSIAENVGGADV
jgi:excisionase family DNA binding protein